MEMDDYDSKSFTFSPHKVRTIKNLIDVFEAPNLLDKLKSLASDNSNDQAISKPSVYSK